VIGCGEGRDALFLSRLGYKVVATDIAEVGLEKARKKAAANKLKCEFIMRDAHESHSDLGKFDCVLLITLLQFLKPETIPERVEHFKSLLLEGGLISIELFTVDDPQYIQAKSSGREETAPFTYRHPVRNYGIRFFEKGELRSYFKDWDMIYYHEGIIWDKPHGTQSEFHEHGMGQLIARKPAKL